MTARKGHDEVDSLKDDSLEAQDLQPHYLAAEEVHFGHCGGPGKGKVNVFDGKQTSNESMNPKFLFVSFNCVIA